MSQEKHRKELSEILEGKVIHYHVNNLKIGHKGRRVTHEPAAAIAPTTGEDEVEVKLHLAKRGPTGGYVALPDGDPNYFGTPLTVSIDPEKTLMELLYQVASTAGTHITGLVTADSSGVDQVPVGWTDSVFMRAN
ncbi:MAG: hypothetical protein LBK56_14220 [Gracilibacteraceae bacterium]|jgi:hypothetical protein|nr:hypothetical protein [Gracilibacteraceae bacterium]